jgi:thioredoxin 1
MALAYHGPPARVCVLSSTTGLCYVPHMADVLAVSDESFEREVLQADTPVLVDFWAPWCAPCRAIAPIVEELSREYDGKLKVVKMNVDDNPKTPSQYGVRGIPTLLVIQGGQVKEQLVGAQPKAKLVSAIGSVVAVA